MNSAIKNLSWVMNWLQIQTTFNLCRPYVSGAARKMCHKGSEFIRLDGTFKLTAAK